jgi:hypothetical protein
MPEANILYAVTAVVVAGLAGWVVAVLRTAKEPWKRAVPVAAAPAEATEDVDDGKVNPDATAEATPVVVPETKEDEKKDETKEEAKES